MMRSLCCATLLGVALTAPWTTSVVAAQETGPVSLIVAYPPGGASDVTARLLGERLAQRLERPVVVENRAGADGIIAMQAVARAPSDGSVLGFAAVSPLAITPHIRDLPFPLEAVEPLVPVMYSPILLIGTPTLDAKDLPGMLQRAREKPGSIRVGNAGTVSVCTLALEQLQDSAGVELTIVPYKGGGQLITDALGGQFEVMCINASPSLIKSFEEGRLTPLAVGAPERLESLKSVPTLSELGFPNANRESVFGLFVPAGLPPGVSTSLNETVNVILAEPAFKARLAEMGNVALGGSADEFKARVLRESAVNAEIIKRAGLTP